MNLKVGPAKNRSLPEIVRLNTIVFAGLYENPPYNLEHYQHKLSNVNSHILVARDEDRLIGDSIAFERNKNWYIWILSVDPEFRRQGVASKLLDLNEKHAKALGLKKVTTKVYNISSAMQRLLISRGYLIIKVELSKSHLKYNAVHFALIL